MSRQTGIVLAQHPGWAFIWTTGRPCATSIIGWTRKAVIDDAEKTTGLPWKRIYALGGRVVRITMEVKR